MKVPTMARIEALESRIAPATIVNPTTVTYTDIDGDLVTITVSKGDLTGRLTFLPVLADGTNTPQQLQIINLALPQFANADLDIVVNNTNGDGYAHVGFLNAKGVDLGDVDIFGDVGKLLAGDAKLNTTAINTLKLHSLGSLANIGAPDAVSIVNGPLGDVTLTGNIVQAQLSVVGALSGTIRSLTAGSLLGGTANYSGSVVATGNIGPVQVGNLQGGGGDFSGTIISGGNLQSFSGGFIVGGSGKSSGVLQVKGNAGGIALNEIDGGGGPSSGAILVGGSSNGITMSHIDGGGGAGSGVIAIGGTANGISVVNLTGGAGFQSGRIDVKGTAGAISANNIQGGGGDFSGSITGGSTIASVSTPNSVTGGAGLESGRIRAAGLIGTIQINGNLAGGSGDFSGSIRADKGLGTVNIGNNVTSSFGIGGGSIISNGEIGSINIGGTATGTFGRTVLISALGKTKLPASAVTNLSLGSVTVGGASTYLDILAGYDVTGKALSADAQIGVVTLASGQAVNIVAGATRGLDGLFGTADDKAITGGLKTVLSRISNIIISGQTTATTDPTDTFGIVAQQVDSISVNGGALTLTAGPSNDKGVQIGAATDFKLFEI